MLLAALRKEAVAETERSTGQERTLQTGRETTGESDTPKTATERDRVREKFQVKNTPHSLSHWPAYGLLRKASKFGQEGQR